MIKIFSIETSCDDTSVGIVNYENGRFEVQKMIAYSQIQDHKKYGGVVPELASRLHSEKIITLLSKFSKDFNNIDFISVTTKPGLPGSLLVGITSANMIGNFYNKEIIEVNHIYGHIFSFLLERKIEEIEFPMMVLTASGGHNDIYLISKIETNNNIFGFKFELNKLGTTLDDACGECFDKVSRMLGGPYPGGSWISQKANQGKQNELIKISRIFLKSDEYNFSFSGMKSKVYYLLQDLEKKYIKLDEQLICDICLEFQNAVVEMLVNKLIKASLKFEVKTIGITGGVSANDCLFEYTQNQVKIKGMQTKVYRPVKKIYSTDNSAMIGVVGLLQKFNMVNDY